MGRKSKTKPVENDTIDNGLQSVVLGLGYSPGDVGTQVSQTDTLWKNCRWYMVSNMRQLLSEMYVEHGLVKTMIDVPVDDALRGGYKIKSKMLDQDDIREIQIYMERQDINTSVIGRALKWNRLFGGAGIIIITDQDFSSELNIEDINEDTPLEFRAVDMWELFWDKQNQSTYDPTIQQDNFEFYDYYGLKLHKSRVIVFKGETAPSFLRPRLRGWGFSIVEVFIRSINQYLKAVNLSFEVLDEFKIDVYKIKNFAQAIATQDGTNRIIQRIQLANQQKNFQNALTMDAEDDHSSKEMNFAGISEIMREVRMQIASDLRMPITKLFGLSANGFNSGQDDIEVYNSMVEGEIRSKIKWDILKILTVCARKKLGLTVDDFEIEFLPLRILTSEQEEAVKSSKLTRVMQSYDSGIINPKQVRESINQDNLLPIQLEITDELYEVRKGEKD